jgi:hypothetical protein
MRNLISLQLDPLDSVLHRARIPELGLKRSRQIRHAATIA